MTQAQPSIEITPLSAQERPLWQAFLAQSANGCLFHDLDFLDYHPAGRFRFEHLVLRQKGKILALLPGGLLHRDGSEVFVSPLGASVGGPVVLPGLRALQALALVQALQEYARTRGWAGLDLTLAPGVFARPATELVPYALFCRGFKLSSRWLCAMLDLESAPAPRYKTFFNQSRQSFARAQARKGMAIVLGGAELLPAFLEVFADTYERHGQRATHSPEEIAWLLAHHPGTIQLCLAMLDGRCTAGVLLFQVRPEVVNTFYICSSTKLAAEQGTVPLFAELADILAQRGVRWLDLGPSSSDAKHNAGVTYFKESIGCLTHCRDRWSWRTQWTNGPALSTLNFFADEAP